MTDPHHILVFDTTLRDGEQSPGATMNLSEKIRMARQLESLGVDIMEAGFPASSPGDFESVAAIAKEMDRIRVAGLARAVEPDIARAAEALRHAKHSRIHLFIATSPLHMEYKLRKKPAEVLEMAAKAVRFAASCSKDVEFSCEDASRSDINFLAEVCDAAIEAGAATINIPDTVGYAQPDEFGARLAELIKRVQRGRPVTFSVHCHNDLGLAVANTLSAIRAGARQVEVTVGGIGERAGNAALEEVVMALNVRRPYYNCSTSIITEQIYPTTRLLSRIIGQPIARNKPIVGPNAFAHESGIHQAGVLSNPETYEIMTPASIGLPEGTIVLGKHSGRNALKSKLESLGYQLDADQLNVVFEAVKRLADKKKEIFDEDVEALVIEEVYRIPDKYRLVHLAVHSGDTGVPPTAMLVMDVDGKPHKHAAFGVGPIDAVFAAINHVTGKRPSLGSYSVNAITGGTDAQGEVTVRLSDAGRNSVGRGSDPDVINASARAYINALNRLYAAPSGDIE